MSGTVEELAPIEVADTGATAIPEPAADPARPTRVWNLNFLLLWAGQLISALGDAVYGIALGFWVLEKTGSTALMGSLMAASTLPRILLSPFAGVLVDRSDRRWALILSDVGRGVAVLAVAVAAYSGRLEIWMVFACGIIISAASAFFFPAVGSSVPDIVPPAELVRANSAFAMLQTGSGIIGNAGGGFLFQVLGAPLMFLANGISYVVAALAEVPMRIPRIRHTVARFDFLSDLKAGFRFVWQYRGIRYMILLAAALNFFAVMGLMLVLPMFQQAPSLGPGKYGLAMAGLTGGMFAGYLFTSLVNIPFARRFPAFYVCGVVSMGIGVLFPVWLKLPALLAEGIVLGATNAVVNSLLNAVLGTVVPTDMRGKVFSLIGTIAGGLMPIAYALGGGLAEVFPVRIVMAAAFSLTLLCFLPTIASGPVRRLVGYNPEFDTLETIR